MAEKTETAVLGGGCFWCTEVVFGALKGVVSVLPGYAGGTVASPTYEQVCSGKTGHAEVIRVEFNPTVVSYRDLLGVFFATHDPTTTNRQGGDVGTQYRSVIYTTSDVQASEARAYLVELEKSGTFAAPIVTNVELLTNFFAAEQYHKNYYANNSAAEYCQAVISPKLAKFRAQYAHLLRP